MPIDNQRLFENRAIVGYIDKSIRNEYIKLSKKRDKIKLNEMELNLDIEISHEDSEYD